MAVWLEHEGEREYGQCGWCAAGAGREHEEWVYGYACWVDGCCAVGERRGVDGGDGGKAGAEDSICFGALGYLLTDDITG